MDKRFKYLVEKYLDNTLSKTQKAVFEKYLEDPACREYLEDAEKIEKIMEEGFRILNKKAARAVRSPEPGVGRQDKKSAIENPQSEIEEDDIPEEIKQDVLKYGAINDPEARAAVNHMHERMIRRNRILFLLKYVIPAVFLIISLIFLWTDYFKPLPQSLYRAWYKPYEYTVISTKRVPDERIRSAMSLYKTADYAGSARLCNEIIASGKHGGDIHFLYGLNLMGRDSMQRAIQEFNAQINSPSVKPSQKFRFSMKDTKQHLPVNWYKSLCYLKLGRPVSALLSLVGMKKDN